MSQGQPGRPQPAGREDQTTVQPSTVRGQQQPIKYGDVFNVSGELADKPIAPEDANMMQSAETRIFGLTPKGGAAAAMQAAATYNEQVGFVRHRDATSAACNQGVSVAETDIPGASIFTERVAGQVVGRYVEARPADVSATAAGVAQGAITIGEALEASAQSGGNKPVDESDAAAIQAAEVRATGSDVITPGGLAATAQSAASYNAQTTRDEDKIKLNEVLTDATSKLGGDKVVTRADAEGVASAEIRNRPDLSTRPGGVAASVTSAARINERIDESINV